MRNLLKIPALIARTHPRLLFTFVLRAAVEAFLALCWVWIPKLVLDAVAAGNGLFAVAGALLPVLAPLGLALILRPIATRALANDNQLFQVGLSERVSDKSHRLAYRTLEDPKALDLKERAIFPVLNLGIMIDALNGGRRLLTSALTILGVVPILWSFHPLLLLAAVALAAGGGLLSGLASRLEKRLTDDMVSVNRRYNYFLQLLLDPDYSKELRIYELDDYVVDRIERENREMARQGLRLRRMRSLISLGQSLLIAVSRVLFLVMAGLRALGAAAPRISIGAFSMVVTANEQLQLQLQEAFAALADLVRVSAQIEPFFEFLELPEAELSGGRETPGPLETLAFENVSFSYPGSSRPILENVSFSLKKGETLALVGKNQAGKSTIVKLICRFFEPTAGRILWNGRDIRELDYGLYLEELSCVFQDIRVFPFRLWMNVAAGETMKDSEMLLPEKLAPSVREVLDRVGLEDAVKALPQRENTFLNRQIYEDGVSLSGGQNQRLAIARALYKNDSFVILDEPTAALDPLAESEVYERFAELVRGKTALFISHRMSASRFCDRILVLERGRIAQSGAHDELVNREGLYRELYMAQAKYYRQAKTLEA